MPDGRRSDSKKHWITIRDALLKELGLNTFIWAGPIGRQLRPLIGLMDVDGEGRLVKRVA